MLDKVDGAYINKHLAVVLTNDPEKIFLIS